MDKIFSIILRLYAEKIQQAIDNLREELPDTMDREEEPFYIGPEDVRPKQDKFLGDGLIQMSRFLSPKSWEFRPTGDFIVLDELKKIIEEMYNDANLEKIETTGIKE